MAIEDRGFASMDRSKQREIASKGGKAAHHKGTAHEWTSDAAREAGRKGGMARHHRKEQALSGSTEAIGGVPNTGQVIGADRQSHGQSHDRGAETRATEALRHGDFL